MDWDDAFHEETATATIDKLNDDCVLLIMDCLPQKDVLALTLVSKRFHQMANRSLQSTFTRKRVEISKFPSSIVRRFGPWIRYLNVKPVADEEMVDAVCQLCPNLISLSFGELLMEAFSKPHFRRTLFRLEELKIEQLLTVRNFKVMRKSVETALQGCAHLTKLSLGTEHNGNLEPILAITYPKLNSFEICFTDPTSNESLIMPFLESHSTLKSVSLTTYRHGNEWNESSLSSTDLKSIIDKLNKIQELKIFTETDEGILQTIFSSANHLKTLTTLQLHANHNPYIDYDFSDEDLLQLRNLSSLSHFEFTHWQSKITLPGILDTIRLCPKLSWIYISGFRQPYMVNSPMLANRRLYNKFRRIYLKEISGDENAMVYSVWRNLGKWHGFGDHRNHINLYKQTME